MYFKSTACGKICSPLGEEERTEKKNSKQIYDCSQFD